MTQVSSAKQTLNSLTCQLFIRSSLQVDLCSYGDKREVPSAALWMMLLHCVTWRDQMIKGGEVRKGQKQIQSLQWNSSLPCQRERERGVCVFVFGMFDAAVDVDLEFH